MGMTLQIGGVSRLKRRAVYFLVGLVGLLLFDAWLYQLGIRYLEQQYDPDRTIGYVQALQFAVETFTTTGYGAESPWQSPLMNLIVIVMDVSGVLLLFAAIPTLVVPWFREALSTTVPSSVGDLEDHVVVCNYTSRGETILDEFESRGVDYVVVEPDADVAEELYLDDMSVIHGDPEKTEVLLDASTDRAEAVVVDASDEANASVILSARAVAPDARIVSLVEHPELTEYLEYAGADTVLLPRHMLGQRIGEQASTSVRAQLGDTVEIGEHFAVAELPVHADSPICGRALHEAGIREETGANIIGIWVDGEFQATVSPGTEIGTNTVLLVSGTEEQIAALRDLTLADTLSGVDQTAVVAGYGEVGATVAETLEDRGMTTVVVDIDEMDGVDIVGDATDADVLREAGVDDAGVFIATLADDTDGIFATLVARELNPSMEIFARANESESISKMYRAGADYVLGLPNVSGRMLALDVLGEEIMTVSRQIKMVRTPAHGLEGRSLADADVRAETGCTVVAVERGDEVLTDVGPAFVVEEGDRVIVAGDDEDINAFEVRFVD